MERQCELLGLPRSSYYYQSQGERREQLLLLPLMDEQYTRTPCYGSPKMTDWLRRQGDEVNHKRIERLMSIMGLQGLAARPMMPKGSLRPPHPAHKKYPYLLKGVKIVRPNQVWCSDLTYLRLLEGFVYLVASMDGFSRYVLSWRISISLEADFCVEALQEALESGTPEIFNTDPAGRAAEVNLLPPLSRNAWLMPRSPSAWTAEAESLITF